ncbi:MAG: hypothetical protein ACRCVT_02435 [Leadbetterella sp.]
MGKYVIMVGLHKPATVIASYPNKDGSPGPNAYETRVTVGAYNLINRFRVWARRVLPDGKLPKNGNSEVPLEMLDSRYKGDLEFLHYGSKAVGAQQIECRYLTTSFSLDYQYQKVVQKIETDPNGKDDTSLLILDAGENRFDTETDAVLVQALKAHPQNRDSKSKNPDPSIKGYTFYEVTDETVDKSYVEIQEKALDAGTFVKELSNNPVQLKNIFDLFKSKSVDFGDVDEKSLDTDIYKSLLVFSQKQPVLFISIIESFKKSISDCFEKARAFKVLDLTKDGTIAVVLEGNPPEILFSKLEGKGISMETSVVSGFYEENIYLGIERLHKICDSLK